jgi:hypothetical protein
VSKPEIQRVLRNWVESGVLLGAAAILSLTIFQVYPFSGVGGRYVGFWIVLPSVWLIAISLTRVAREFVLARYEDLGSTPRRVVAGGAIAAALIAYVTIITSNIPETRSARETHPVTNVAQMH